MIRGLTAASLALAALPGAALAHDGHSGIHGIAHAFVAADTAVALAAGLLAMIVWAATRAMKRRRAA